MTDTTAAGTATAAQVTAAYRRYALTVLLIIYTLNFLDRQIMATLAEPIKRDLGLSDTALGLMIGIVLSGPGEQIHAALRERGFVCNLAHGTVLRLLPPLTIAAEDLLAFAAALDDILGSDKA